MLSKLKIENYELLNQKTYRVLKRSISRGDKELKKHILFLMEAWPEKRC